MATTFDDLIMSIEVELEQVQKNRERAVARVKGLLARASQEGRANLTEDEDADVVSAFATKDRCDRDIIAIENRLKHARAGKADEERVSTDLASRAGVPSTADAQLPAYDRVARVASEPRTYTRESAGRTGGGFIRDVVRSFLFRDVAAEGRISRHMNEERVENGKYLERAVGTGAFAGLVVPAYLTALYAPAVAARRPFADAMTNIPLPATGMTVNISRITTPSAAALQTENVLVQTTDMDDTLLTENVQTAAGRQVISRQAIERGTGIEDVVMNDLQRRLATNLDSTIINQAVTGLAALATVVAYTDTSPTQVEAYPKIVAGMAGSEAALLGQATPDLVVMHSRRWHWFNAAMTSTWPLFAQPGIPTQAAGVNFAERYGSGFRGVLPNGAAAIVDNNVPTNIGAGTNEDEIYVVPSEESYLWEDPDAPQFIRAEQSNASTLGVELVLYTYFAYTMRRYANSHQKVQGTGLIPPTF